MIARCGQIFLPCLMILTPLHGQQLRDQEVAFGRSPFWEISVRSYYTNSRFTGQWYPNTTLGVTYLDGSFSIGTAFNLNQQQNFTFQPPRLIIEVSGRNVQFSDSTRFVARPEIYNVEQPVRLSSRYQRGRLGLFASITSLIQHSEIEQPDLRAANDSLFVLNWIATRRKRTDLLSNLGLSYNFSKLRLEAGGTGFPLLRIGDESFKHEYVPQARPFATICWEQPQRSVQAITDFLSYSFHIRELLGFFRFGQQALQARVDFSSGLSDFSFYMLGVGLRLPLSRRLNTSIDYHNVWSPNGPLTRKDFSAWQRSSSLGGLRQLNFNLPHQVVKVGLSWTLDSIAPRWPLQVLQFRLLQSNIFAAKREFYANNPIATIDLLNSGERPIEVQLRVKTTEGSATFRSAAFTLGAKEIKGIPLYLYLSNKDFHEAVKSEQLLIEAIVANRSRTLVSQLIRVYGRHAWDGNTWGLRYFVAPDDPTINSQAKKIYLTSVKEDVTVGSKARLLQVKTFISEFGKSLRYIPDPITSLDVDQVQYPIETYLNGGGDCEDLTVCLASGLMAVGMNAAVVDVRPKSAQTVMVPTAKSGAIGHVFLLVDTGIPATRMSELGLNEFQAISRNSADGQNTIWLPIETASLAKGFEAAFRDGVKQYYQEVIEKNGVTKGNVHVYDF